VALQVGNNQEMKFVLVTVGVCVCKMHLFSFIPMLETLPYRMPLSLLCKKTRFMYKAVRVCWGGMVE